MSLLELFGEIVALGEYGPSDHDSSQPGYAKQMGMVCVVVTLSVVVGFGVAGLIVHAFG